MSLDHWHLTPQSGEVKGNNPYQLNRMTVDPSFRAPSTYDIKDIQGYSATGEVVLKGQPLSPPRESSTPSSVEAFRASGKRGRKRNRAKLDKLNELVNAHHVEPAHPPKPSKPASKYSKFPGLDTEWQQATAEARQSELAKLTAARYAAIMNEDSFR